MLDQLYHFANYGKYTPMPDLPIIDHPVILADGMHFYCLSFSPAADGTRAEDWHHVNLSGVRPVCACPDFTYRSVACKHLREVLSQADALCQARTARWDAARKAARQEGRAA